MRNVIIFGLLLVLGMTFYCAEVGQAQTFAPVPVTATFPAGTFSGKISKVIANYPYDGTTDTWPLASAPSETSMSFGSLVELTDAATGAKLGVFAPSDRRYYVIDLAVSGGGLPSTLNVSVAWTGDAVLASHTSVTCKTVKNDATGKTIDVATIAGPQAANATIRNLTIADFTNKWVRMIVGIYVRAAGATSDPAGLSPFTAADIANTYSGQLTVTVL
jgi:hypothetical protein